MALTDKQARFVAEYLVDLNATQAAIRAGYSPKTAQQQGSRLLLNVVVSEAISAGQQSRSTETGLTAARVLEEVRRIALGDIGELFDENSNLRPIKDLPPSARAMIASVEVVKRYQPGKDEDAPVEYVHKVRLWDKGAQLANALKHLGLLVEKQELSGTVLIVTGVDRGDQG